ncbi:serine-rich adhesin for platelets-like [Mytilus edulis]|uniref:serine-rich adhesin for platelets-like n=2 Tax=Mytilus TaxID=6548 RepID=UPI0039EE28B7
MLQEKKEKEISRKQTLHSAEDYILNNLICSSTSTNINSFQPPYFTMPPFNYIPPPISSSSNSIALTSSLGSAPFNSMSRSYPLTSSLGSAPFNSMSHSIPLTSSLGSAPFNSMSRSIPLTSSLGSAPFNSMSCSIPLTSSLGSAPFNSLSHSIPLTSSLGSAPVNSLYNSIPLTSSLGSEPFNSLSNSIPLTSSLGSAPFNSLSHSVPITSSLGSAPFNSLSNSIPITSSFGSAPFNSLSNSIPITSSFGSAPFNSLSNSIPLTSSLGSAPFNSLSDSIPITSSFSSAPFNSLSHSIPTAVSSAISLNNFSATPFSPISLDRSTFRLGSCDMPPSSFCSTPIPPRCLFPSNSSCTTSPYTSLLTDSHLSSLDTCSAYQVPSSTPLNSSSLQQNRPSKTWTISKPVDSLTHSPHTDLSTTSSILSNSFSVLNTEIQVNDTSSFSCKSCLVHENQIQSLKTALSQAREDSCRLHQRIRELEAMQNNNALVSSTDEQTDEVIDHYTPLRGVKVDYSNYVIISSEDNLPNGYERITDCSDVAVPRKWLIQILGVCKGKSSSYCVKKFIDGFFEPEEFIHLSASKAVATMPVMKAIRLYAINKLRMRDAEFMSALNSKIGTFKRSVKMERRIVKSLNI